MLIWATLLRTRINFWKYGSPIWIAKSKKTGIMVIQSVISLYRNNNPFYNIPNIRNKNEPLMLPSVLCASRLFCALDQLLFQAETQPFPHDLFIWQNVFMSWLIFKTILQLFQILYLKAFSHKTSIKSRGLWS